MAFGGTNLAPGARFGSGLVGPGARPAQTRVPRPGGVPNLTYGGRFAGGFVGPGPPNPLQRPGTDLTTGGRFGGGFVGPGGTSTGGAPITGPGGGGKGKGNKPPSPLDAEYYQNVANYLFKTNNSINQAQQQEGFDRTALQSALGQLQYQQPRDDLALEERANQAGALYSSGYGQQLGNLNYQYAGREGGLQSASGSKLAQLAAQIASLRGGVPLYENAQAYLSAQRAAAAAAKNPALGESTKPLRTGKQGGKGQGQSLVPQRRR